MVLPDIKALPVQLTRGHLGREPWQQPQLSTSQRKAQILILGGGVPRDTGRTSHPRSSLHTLLGVLEPARTPLPSLVKRLERTQPSPINYSPVLQWQEASCPMTDTLVSGMQGWRCRSPRPAAHCWLRPYVHLPMLCLGPMLPAPILDTCRCVPTESPQ